MHSNDLEKPFQIFEIVKKSINFEEVAQDQGR